ncbi:hypothetical protein HPB50_024025 [Hyalomma asiaticum]|uniref:Uncharacterized protein n=1 Tax=Hyalomma asiaticum TaxID=266040 RepID=A0ACB7T1P2_HYAAI|nr:hypothetical protein HPB50_024025 [Hyalomma asiaticum]
MLRQEKRFSSLHPPGLLVRFPKALQPRHGFSASRRRQMAFIRGSACLGRPSRRPVARCKPGSPLNEARCHATRARERASGRPRVVYVIYLSHAEEAQTVQAVGAGGAVRTRPASP